MTISNLLFYYRWKPGWVTIKFIAFNVFWNTKLQRTFQTLHVFKRHVWLCFVVLHLTVFWRLINHQLYSIICSIKLQLQQLSSSHNLRNCWQPHKKYKIKELKQCSMWKRWNKKLKLFYHWSQGIQTIFIWKWINFCSIVWRWRRRITFTP